MDGSVCAAPFSNGGVTIFGRKPPLKLREIFDSKISNETCEPVPKTVAAKKFVTRFLKFSTNGLKSGGVLEMTLPTLKANGSEAGANRLADVVRMFTDHDGLSSKLENSFFGIPN